MSPPMPLSDAGQRTSSLSKATALAPTRLHSRLHALLLAGVTLLLSACASQPPTPDWQANAFAALKGFSSAYLSGNSRLADSELARAKSEIARTGRADLMARAELTRCAVRVASLEFDGCASYQPLAPEVTPQEQAYAAFLNGQWADVNPTLLPAQYRAWVSSAAAQPVASPGMGSAATAASQLTTLEDPLARLVAAGVLLQTQRLSPEDIEVAVDAAASQGWRRPLLAWLGVQRQRADAAGDTATSARLQRRINLVLSVGSSVTF